MDTTISQILSYSILPTVVTSFFTLYLTEKVKGKVKSNFDSKLEKLKNSHNLELSKFQAEINSLKTRENFKFTRLHEKRLEIMEITYKQINEVLIELHRYVTPLKMREQGKSFLENDNVLQKNFLDKHSYFKKYFTNNRFYFDRETKILIDNYLKDVGETYDLYNEKHSYNQMGEKPDREILKKASQAFKNIELKIIPIKENIESKFSEILEK